MFAITVQHVREKAVVLLSFLVYVCTAFAAEDFVKIRFHPANTVGTSLESTEIAVSRVTAYGQGAQQDVDRFFDEVRRVISASKIPPRWGSAIIDGQFVEVEITLGGTRFELISAYGAQGLMLPTNATSADKRIAAAFSELLDLTVARARARFATK